jgi:ADP-ribosylation factor related protein 1
MLEHEDTVGIPVLALANKQDREGYVEVVRMVFKGQGSKVRDSRVLPVSVLKGAGVRAAVELVRSRAFWSKESRPPVMR